jgi:hypothetical protein
MTRTRASATHLIVSSVVGLTAFFLFKFVWYPGEIFRAVGALHIFAILILVDIVLGPLLTLIVFDPQKKSLRFDLFIIITIQVTALAYGVFTLLQGRPIYVAALGHRFDIVHATEVADDDLKVARAQFSWLGPDWVGTKKPDDKKERERILFSAIGGADYGHFPQHHQPIEKMRDEILKNAQPISDLKKLNPGDQAAIDKWLTKRDVTEDSVRYQGLKARAKDMAVIVDAKTAKVIGIAPFKPWP